jgi:hypothetical protein
MYPMKRFAPALALVVGAAIALTATVAVSPSYAAETPRTLPAGQTMFALSYDGRDASDLHSVDASTAVSTPVGSGIPTEGFSSYQPAWDAVTNTAYFLDQTTGLSHLSTMNISTGVHTVGAEIKLGGNPKYADAIAISPSGDAFAVSGTTLYSLNLIDGALTQIGSTNQSELYGFAFNPAGVLYGLDTGGNLYTINTTSGVSTLVTTFSFPSNADPATPETSPYSIQFDSNGILWIENDSPYPSADLWSADLTVDDPAASAVRSGEFVVGVGGSSFYTEALLIVPFAVPVFTSAAEAAGTVGSAFTFTATTSGGAGTTFAITAGTLPAGLVLDAATGIISGTPTGAGTSTFTITASNMVGMTEQPFTLAIAAAAAVIHLPVVSG